VVVRFALLGMISLFTLEPPGTWHVGWLAGLDLFGLSAVRLEAIAAQERL